MKDKGQISPNVGTTAGRGAPQAPLQDGEDLDSFLGVTFTDRRVKRGAVPVECGQAPPKERRHTEWNNFQSFAFTGYVAKVTRFHCTCCDNLWDDLIGVFISETHLPTGTRRLQQLAPKGDWPSGPGDHHRKEVEDREVPFCGGCIGDLGFDREVDARGQPYTHPSNAVLRDSRHESTQGGSPAMGGSKP